MVSDDSGSISTSDIDGSKDQSISRGSRIEGLNRIKVAVIPLVSSQVLLTHHIER